MLRVKLVEAGYRGSNFILRGINLHTEQGDVVAVLGPSGSGKTTLLKVIAGVIPYIEEGFIHGSISYGDLELVGARPRKRPIAYLPQDPSDLVLGDTGYEVLKIYGASNNSILRVNELISKRVNEMSSGELQRLVIASVLSQGRDVILLDEPLANLDVLASKDALDVIMKVAEGGGIVFIAEHRVSKVINYVTKVLVLHEGKQLYFGENIEYGIKLAEEVGVREALVRAPNLKSLCRELNEEAVAIADNVTIGYGGKAVVRGLTFICPNKSLVAVVGPNGSGKTTLLRALAGVIKPMEGVIRYSWGSWSWREIGWVPPNPWLGFLRNSVGDEVMSVAKRAGIPNYDSWCLEVLEVLGLKGHINDRPWELSGGERMRLAIAKALAKKPKLILLDEPLRGQDRRFAEAIFDIVKDVTKLRSGCAAIVTHDVEFLGYTDYTYLISRGCFLSG